MFAMLRFRRLLRDDEGATAIEYGLIISLLVLAIIGGVNVFAQEATTMLNGIATAVENARPD